MSKNKGARTERLLRDHLRTLGYDAERVPLSGASAAMKGDVIATKGDTKLVFEMKARKDSFKSIYALLGVLPTVRFSLDGHCVCLSKHLHDALLPHQVYYHVDQTPEVDLRTMRRVIKMQELLKGAHVLVLKDNNKPLLFIRYW